MYVMCTLCTLCVLQCTKRARTITQKQHITDTFYFLWQSLGMSPKCTCMPHACHVHTVHVHARWAQYMYCQCTQCHNNFTSSVTMSKKTKCVCDVLLLRYGPCTLCALKQTQRAQCAHDMHVTYVCTQRTSSGTSRKKQIQNQMSGCGSMVHAHCEKKIYQPSTFEKHNVHEKNSCVQSMHAMCIIKVCVCR